MKYIGYWIFLLVTFQDFSCHKRWKRRSQHHSLMTRRMSWRSPSRGRRQGGGMSPLDMLQQEQKKSAINNDDIHDFYEPYEPMGDFVFLRTTKPPIGASTIKTGNVEPSHTIKGHNGLNFDLGYYENAKIEDYRGCNLVCPAIFIKYGAICAWTKVKFRGWFYKWDWWYGNHWNGSHDYIEIKDFPNICEMLKANCRDYTKDGSTHANKWLYHYHPTNHFIRRIYRLLHLGYCGEGTEARETVIPWQLLDDTKQEQVLFWETETNKVMSQVNNISNFLTRRTTRVKPKDVDDFSFIG